MAGHSKWANIKFRKAAQDAKRGKLFTKLIREITVAARSGGGDADSNPRLRAAIDKALGANMTRDTVDRAVKRGTGERYSTDSALAKLYATEAAWRIADRALQIHGGYGYTRDFPLERYLRDLRIFRIYEGSSEIQRTIIARTLLA